MEGYVLIDGVAVCVAYTLVIGCNNRLAKIMRTINFLISFYNRNTIPAASSINNLPNYILSISSYQKKFNRYYLDRGEFYNFLNFNKYILTKNK